MRRIRVSTSASPIRGLLANGKRVPFGRPALELAPGIPVEISWQPFEVSGVSEATIAFRVTAAVHSNHRQFLSMECPGASTFSVDLPLVSPWQPVEFRIMPEFSASGRALVRVSDAPVFLFADSPENGNHAPHFLLGDEPPSFSTIIAFLQSDDSLQGFHWMEACILDALMDLGCRNDAQRRLERFFNAEGSFVGEDVWGRPSNGLLQSVENQGGFAALAQIHPNHPALEEVIAFWMKHRDPVTGSICDGGIAAESSYAVAYPLMVLGVVKDRQDWRKMALQVLRANRDALVGPSGEIWLRRSRAGDRTFRGWARGVCWYLLGLARTLRAAPDGERPEELIGEIGRALKWVFTYQRPDGLWSNFIEETELMPDTSGSAGIAAAYQIAINEGFIEPGAKDRPALTAHALDKWLAADGCLGGVAPGNSGGEALQRESLRILAPFASGLAGQLHAAREAAGRSSSAQLRDSDGGDPAKNQHQHQNSTPLAGAATLAGVQ